MNIWVQLIIMIIMMIISYVLTPRPKSGDNAPPDALQAPTADASRPIPVVFGTITIKSPNCLWYGDISQQTLKVKA